MKFIFILLFSFILTSQSKQGLTNSIFGEISKSSMINPAHPSDELVDLLYLKIISELFNIIVTGYANHIKVHPVSLVNNRIY